MKKILILIALLFAVEVEAARFVRQPECPHTGHATCSDGIDNDADGTVDEAAPTTAWQADGVNYRANLSDCAYVNFSASTDASFASADYLAQTQNEFWNAEIACGGSFTNATYDVFIYYSLPVGPLPIWVGTSSHGHNPNNAINASILAQVATATWANNTAAIQTTGSNVNFKNNVNSSTKLTLALNGNAAIYIKTVPGVRLGAIYLREASDTTQPSVPDETPSGESAHYVAYKLSGSAPANCADAQFDAANIWDWVGTNSSADATPTLKFLHDATKFYICGTFLDNDLRATTTGNDDSAVFNDDRLEFSFRTDTATTARDANTFKLVVNPQNAKYSANYPSATADTSQSFSEVCTVTLTGDLDSTADDTSWAVFCTLTSPFALSDGLQIRATVFRSDVDGTGTTSQAGYGSINTPSTWPIITISGTTVPGGADVTAPTVTNVAVAAATIEETSAIVTADTNENGTCVVRYGTVTKTYTLQTSGTASVNGVCAVAMGVGGAGSQTDPPLTAATQYFLVVDVTDAASNVGTSSEANFTTDAAAPPTCTHYAGPTTAGAADGSSNANRFLINSFWAVATPGKSLCLADGNYTGTNSMIDPPVGVSGTQLAPIKITGTNDGGAIINGEGARRPIQLANNNDWLIIERIDVHNSSSTVVEISGNSDNNIIRRVVAWDCPVTVNCVIFGLHGGVNNLVEDSAAFGSGRKMFTCSQAGQANCRYRRVWGAWTKYQTNTWQPKMVASAAYNAYGTIMENMIGTWHEEDVANNVAGNRYGIFASGGMTGADVCSNGKYVGSIAYMRGADSKKDNLFGMQMAQTTTDCFTYDNVVNYIEPSTHNGQRSVSLPNLSATVGGPSENGHNVIRNTWIGGNGSDSIGSDWNITSSENVATVGAASNIWDGAGTTGARVCFRYQDGVLTSTKLWPWPMDDRINAALTASGRNPNDYFGTGNTLTDLMASIFGAIPAGCTN